MIPVAAAAGALGKLVADVGIKLERHRVRGRDWRGIARARRSHCFGRPVVKVNEFTAIGVGGTSLAHKDSALVVSLGTGTAIVSVNRATRFAHCQRHRRGRRHAARPRQAHARSFDIDAARGEAARKGDLRRVDLSVRDIAGGPIGDLPPGTTAANFGKVSADATPDDKALAIMNMIVEVDRRARYRQRARLRSGTISC